MHNSNANEYRSPGIVRGQFRQLGGIHLHVDAAADYDFLLSILKQMEPRFPGKITVITASVAGPQRKQLPQVYASHTPGAEDEEEFECFLTLNLDSRYRGIKCVCEVIERLSQHAGAVVEVETVVGRIENSGNWESIPVNGIEPIRSQEVGFKPALTKTLELHHGINFPSGDPSISLVDVLRISQETGIRVGGWFKFARMSGVCFRSNSFHDVAGIQEVAESEHRRLHEWLANRGIHFELWSTVEFVLGIWKVPFTRLT